MGTRHVFRGQVGERILPYSATKLIMTRKHQFCDFLILQWNSYLLKVCGFCTDNLKSGAVYITSMNAETKIAEAFRCIGNSPGESWGSFTI